MRVFLVRFSSLATFILFFFPRACVFGRFFEFGDVYSVFFLVRVFLVRFSSIATLVC